MLASPLGAGAGAGAGAGVALAVSGLWHMLSLDLKVYAFLTAPLHFASGAAYVHKLVEVQAQGVASPAVSSIVATQVASGPLATLVHCTPPPPAQVPTLCGSQAAWLAGAAILLQALFVDAGIHVSVVHAL